MAGVAHDREIFTIDDGDKCIVGKAHENSLRLELYNRWLNERGQEQVRG